MTMSVKDKDDHGKRLLPSPVSASTASQHSSPVIAAVVMFYFATSLSVVFLNKFILSYSEFKFPFPLTVTMYQLFVAWVILLGCGWLGQRNSMFSVIPPYEFKRDVACAIYPLTIVYVLMLAFNNLCLQFVEVTFYQVARSLTILFTTFFTYYLLGAHTSRPALVSCAIVFVGFLMGSLGEMRFTWSGTVFGLFSSCFVALYGIYVKKALKQVEDNEWRLLHYNTTLSLAFMFPLVIFSGELSEISQTIAFLNEPKFWMMMTFTGFTAFLINISMFMQIKFTTPLTNTISGTAKACVQTMLAAYMFQNPISPLNAFGILMSLIGSALYSYVRYKEMLQRIGYSVVNK